MKILTAMYLWTILKSIRCFDPLPYAPITSWLDRKEYQLGTLKNGITVLLVHSPMETNINLCLAVEAGSRDDPIAFEGVARLTEYIMTYFGEIYSLVESGLLPDRSLHPKLGLNADTEHHNMTYMLSASGSSIDTKAGVMAELMTKPRLELIDMKLQVAILEEWYSLYINYSPFKMTDILADLHTAEGCILRDGFGNGRTLGHPSILESVGQFWERNYYGQKMSLVINSSLTFEEMQEVADRFSEIRSDPNIKRANAYPREYDQEGARGLLASFSPIEDLKLKSDVLQYIYKTDIIGHASRMYITIFLPSFLKYDRFVPLDLVQDFIRKQLLVYARTRLNKLGCRMREHYAEHRDRVDYAAFRIELELSARGSKHYREALDIVLGALKNIDFTEQSVKMWVHRKKILWNDAINQCDHGQIKNLSIAALFRHPMDIVSGGHLYKAEEIDQLLIRKLLSYIADFNNWVVIIMGKDYEPGDGDLLHTINNIYYVREKKPSYSPDSQCCVYEQPGERDRSLELRLEMIQLH